MEKELLKPLYLNPEEQEYSNIERTFRENGYFCFSGANTIRNIDDVAYLFRSLGDFSIENAFACLVKDQQPLILHIGMGNFKQTPVFTSALLAAVDKVQPDEVYFIHNHPSGTLEPSLPDINYVRRLGSILGDTLKEGIIINLTSGKYGIYDSDTRYTMDFPNPSGNKPVTVYSFDKYVFHPEYIPSTHITCAREIAQFISSHRLGQRNKLNFFSLNGATNITGNLVTPFTTVDMDNYKEVAAYIASRALHVGAMGVIPYGNVGIENRVMEKLEKEIKFKSYQELSMVDFLQVTPRKVYSWLEQDTLLTVAEIQQTYFKTENNMKENKYRIDEAKIDWSEISAKFGVTRENLTEKVLNDILNKKISSELVSVTYESQNGVREYPSRIELWETSDSVSFRFYPRLDTLDLTEKYNGHSFTPEEQEALLNQKNVVAEIDDYQQGGTKTVLITYDELTNRLFNLNLSKFKLPATFLGATLTPETGAKLLSGETEELRNMFYNGKTFAAPIRINACTRSIEIVNPPKKIIHNLDELKEVNGAAITPEKLEKLKNGEKFELKGQTGKNGGFTSTIWFDFNTRTIQHEFPDKRQKSSLTPS